MVAKNGLYGWQDGIRIMVEESDLQSNIMITAPSSAGKSHLLNELASNEDVTLIEGGYNFEASEIESKYEENHAVLIDEGGMLTDVQGIARLLEEYPDTQTVIATVPDCPSMAMVKPRFDLKVSVSNHAR